MAAITTPGVHLVAFDEITLDTSRDYLVKGVLPREGLAVIWGAPKCGKTFWTFDLAMHVAAGRPYRDRRVCQGSVIYIAAEGERGLKKRALAFRQEMMAEDPAAVPFYLRFGRADLIADHAALVDIVRDEVPGENPVLVVIDTLNRTMRGSESNDQDMSDYVRAVDAIREAFGCCVAIIHHTGWAEDRMRGHRGLQGAADAEIAVKKEPNGAVSCRVVEEKDGPGDAEFFSTLRVVEIGEDEDGDIITSCVIEPADAQASTNLPKLSANQRNALDQLLNAISDHGQDPPNTREYPTGVKVVSIEQWREYLERASIINRDGNPREQFKRLKDALVSNGAICIWDARVWVVPTTVS